MLEIETLRTIIETNCSTGDAGGQKEEKRQLNRGRGFPGPRLLFTPRFFAMLIDLDISSTASIID